MLRYAKYARRKNACEKCQNLMEDKVHFLQQELYDALVRAQEFIQGELAFMEMTQQIGRSKLRAGSEAVTDLLVKMKGYWVAQYHAELWDKEGKNDRLVKEYNAHEQRGRVEVHTEQLDWNKKSLAQYLAKIDVKQGDKKDEVDYITFSLVPSLFRFFVFESETNMFKEWLKQIKSQGGRESILKQLLRVLFRTPHFLRYVETVMSPFLRRMLTELRQKKTEEGRANFIRTQVVWLCEECKKPESRRLFPQMLRVLLDDDAFMRDVFGEAEYPVQLMKMFLDDLAECPQKFMGWKYHEGLSTELKFDEQAAHFLSEAMFEKSAEREGTSLVPWKFEQIDPPSCALQILNNRDLSFLDDLRHLRTGDNNYTIHVVPYDCGRQSELDTMTMTQTQLRGGPLVVGLRKLLKASPPLRPGLKFTGKFTNEYTPTDFVRDVLVAPCEPEYVIPQLYALEDLAEAQWTDYEDIDSLQKVFEEMFVQHKNTVRLLVKEEKLAQALVTTGEICEHAVAALPKFVGIALIKHLKAKSPKLSSFGWHDAISYVHHPRAFHSRLNEWLALFENENSVPTLRPLTCPESAWLHFHYVCSDIGLDFTTYRAVNNHLQTYDSMLESFMARGKSDTEYASDKQKADFKDIVAFRRALASGTELQVEAAEVFRTNFDPLTKAEELQSLMKHVVDYYVKRYRLSDKDVGFVLLEKLQRIFFTYGWNPTCLASFYGYLNDFVVEWYRSYAKLDVSYEMKCLTKLVSDACNEMGIQPWMLSRCCQLDHKIAFVGDIEARQTIFAYLANVDESVFSGKKEIASHFSAVVPYLDGSKAFVFEVFAVDEKETCEQCFSDERKPEIDVFIASLRPESRSSLTTPLAKDQKLVSDLKCFKNCKLAIAFNGTEKDVVKVDALPGGTVQAITIPKDENNEINKETILGKLREYLCKE